MLMFGHIVPNYAGSKEPHIEDTVGVTMAWEHMKALVTALNTAIDGYEKENGAIRNVPTEISPQTVLAKPSGK